jgi:hypothetical protein
MQFVCAILSSVALPGSAIFFHLISWTVRFSGKKLLNVKCVFWYSLQIWSEIFLILRRNERDMIKIVYWSSCKVPVILDRLVKLDFFSGRFWNRYSNIKFHDNPCSGNRGVPCGRIDMTKLRVTFRSFVNAPKKALLSCCDASGFRNGDSPRLSVAFRVALQVKVRNIDGIIVCRTAILFSTFPTCTVPPLATSRRRSKLYLVDNVGIAVGHDVTVTWQVTPYINKYGGYACQTSALAVQAETCSRE